MSVCFGKRSIPRGRGWNSNSRATRWRPCGEIRRPIPPPSHHRVNEGASTADPSGTKSDGHRTQKRCNVTRYQQDKRHDDVPIGLHPRRGDVPRRLGRQSPVMATAGGRPVICSLRRPGCPARPYPLSARRAASVRKATEGPGGTTPAPVSWQASWRRKAVEETGASRDLPLPAALAWHYGNTWK